MRPLRLALVPIGIVFGLVTEWVAYESGSFGLVVADFVVGCVLICCGAVAWERRPESRVGELMSLAGFTWFLGTVFTPALYLHRGPLVHLHLSYPTGRLPTRLALAVVTAAYVDAAISPLARNDALTLLLSAAVALAAVQVFVRTSGTARKAARPALRAALAFAGVLAFGAIGRAAGWNADTILWTYDVVIASLVIVLFVDLMRRRWVEAVVTGLVVDLGSGEVDTLRTKLAGALGDPSLVVGYRRPASDTFIDERGLTVELPEPGTGRVVTRLDDRGETVAVLIHDEALLTDAKLLASVAAAARIAMANARLQAEAQAGADELDASRRRIVAAGAAQRRRLEQELRLGAERRLDNVAALLAEARATSPTEGEPLGELESELDEARRELREFALGVHPAVLSEGGLMPALALLGSRSPIPVRITGSVARLPEPVETALYFVCSEALANTVKHADATHVSIDLHESPAGAVLEISDDGVGGANADLGSGLRGLVDRVDALGCELTIDSPRAGGTRVSAAIPVALSQRV
jgi:signal transduction histidine kinase